MKRAGLLAAAALAAACRTTAQQAPPFDGEQAHRWVTHMVAAGPRVPGTEAHRIIGDWLLAELRARADTVEVQSWVHVTEQGDSLPLRNFLARFRPQETGRVLYVSHWDSRPTSAYDPDPAKRTLPTPGANDGGSSTALLLGVADALKRQPPALGVDLLFVDGEDYGHSFDGPDVLLGSRHFARSVPASYRPLFAVVWDMVGRSDAQFLQEGHSLVGAPEVVERVWSAADALGLGRMFRARSMGNVTDDHVPLLEVGIRAINVIDQLGSNGYVEWHTTLDLPDRVSPETLRKVGGLALYLIR